MLWSDIEKSMGAWGDKIIDGVAKVSVALVGFIILVMSFTIASGAISRYGFNAPLPWMEEFAGALMLPIFFLPLLYVLRKNRHIRIDLLSKRLPLKSRTCLMIGNSLLGVGYAGFLTYEGLRLTQQLLFYQVSYVMIPLPRAVSAMIIPMGMVIFGLGCLALMVSQIRSLSRKSSKAETVIHEL